MVSVSEICEQQGPSYCKQTTGKCKRSMLYNPCKVVCYLASGKFCSLQDHFRSLTPQSFDKQHNKNLQQGSVHPTYLPWQPSDLTCSPPPHPLTPAFINILSRSCSRFARSPFIICHRFVIQLPPLQTRDTCDVLCTYMIYVYLLV